LARLHGSGAEMETLQAPAESSVRRDHSPFLLRAAINELGGRDLAVNVETT